MHWIPVGASLFASNIGSGHFIGLAGSGASSGIINGAYELNSLIVLIILGWYFVPVYTSSRVVTMPEYMCSRFEGQRIRIFLSFQALLLYIFTKISADLYAGSLFIKESLGWKGESGFYLSVLVLLIIACIFTIAGGLSAVIWTDFVQTILMLAGSLYLMVLAFVKVGGYESLLNKYSESEADANYSSYKLVDGNNVSCGAIDPNFMHFFRPIDDGSIPWTGYLGITISSIWYWCADQVIVQRTLSAKNISHAKAACLLAGYIKLLPLFLLVFPGMAARVLFKNEVGCSDPIVCKSICDEEGGCSNIAFIRLVLTLMPNGARGLMIAVMLAALMSSLTSIFNSASTIFTIDIWNRFRKDCSEIEQVIVGRCFVIFLVLISVLWMPLISFIGNAQLFIYIQAISAYLAPQVTVMFLMALFWKRMTESGAFWGLITGFVFGMLRLILEIIYSPPACGKEDTRPAFVILFVGNIHFLHYGTFLFFLTGIVIISVSLATDPIPEYKLNGLLYFTRNEPVEYSVSKSNLGKSKSSSHQEVPNALRMACCLKKQEKTMEPPSRKKTLSYEEHAKLLHENKCTKEILYIQAAFMAAACGFVSAFYF
ncbi:SLC5A9 [Lepeophtheirus salmonis]|uniref:SLC5A9 n=1 Tax=Lepeophtheirus salmonis TaxID=72036 RepID=A0A7R8H490_LEPSM|nr:SLC5A9 [Lepeophtheirus salmonis]CAF2853421.1 SLC5A9 [Lepeophtheirus salmonis]